MSRRKQDPPRRFETHGYDVQRLFGSSEPSSSQPGHSRNPNPTNSALSFAGSSTTRDPLSIPNNHTSSQSEHSRNPNPTNSALSFAGSATTRNSIFIPNNHTPSQSGHSRNTNRNLVEYMLSFDENSPTRIPLFIPLYHTPQPNRYRNRENSILFPTRDPLFIPGYDTSSSSIPPRVLRPWVDNESNRNRGRNETPNQEEIQPVVRGSSLRRSSNGRQQSPDRAWRNNVNRI